MIGRNEVFVLWELPEPDVRRLRLVKQDLEARLPRPTPAPAPVQDVDDEDPEHSPKRVGA